MTINFPEITQKLMLRANFQECDICIASSQVGWKISLLKIIFLIKHFCFDYNFLSSLEHVSRAHTVVLTNETTACNAGIPYGPQVMSGLLRFQPGSWNVPRKQ